MKIINPSYTLPHQLADTHVRFARPPSTVIGEATGAGDLDGPASARDDDTYEADVRSDMSDDGSASIVSVSDAGAPSPFDSLPFPRAPEPPQVERNTSWAASLVGVFDVWVERLEQVVEVLRITVTGFADELTGRVTHTRGALVGAVDAISSAITASLENVRYRVHGFLGRKI